MCVSPGSPTGYVERWKRGLSPGIGSCGHGSPSASLRPRQPEVQGWRMGISAQAETERGNLPFFWLVFCGFSVDGIIPTTVGREGHLCYVVHQLQCWSVLDALSPIHYKIMSYHLTGHPLAQASWHVKSTIHRLYNVSITQLTHTHLIKMENTGFIIIINYRPSHYLDTFTTGISMYIYPCFV